MQKMCLMHIVLALVTAGVYGQLFLIDNLLSVVLLALQIRKQFLKFFVNLFKASLKDHTILEVLQKQ